jgi:NAD(P)-dependent dehydrogenase (short-subunit alcohol dehydrogenase family)
VRQKLHRSRLHGKRHRRADNGWILVTGAAGQLGSVGRTVTGLLLGRGLSVRAMVRREDDRSASLRAAGAEVVVGDLLEPADVHRVVSGCRRVYFGMSVSAGYLEATVTMAAVGPRSQDMHGVAREFSDALNREVTYADIPHEKWERALEKAGVPEHLALHLLTMAELHRAGRYDRLADGVERVTGRPATSVGEFVSLHADQFGGRRPRAQ